METKFHYLARELLQVTHFILEILSSNLLHSPKNGALDRFRPFWDSSIKHAVIRTMKNRHIYRRYYIFVERNKQSE